MVDSAPHQGGVSATQIAVSVVKLVVFSASPVPNWVWGGNSKWQTGEVGGSNHGSEGVVG